MWTSFFTWLTGQVNNFIATQVGTVSTLLEPAVITLASVYVMMWGYLQLTGKIEDERARRFVAVDDHLGVLDRKGVTGPIDMALDGNGVETVGGRNRQAEPARGAP